MPINLPNLDDRRYADLVDEARALIPALAPEWTNHNPSDPGITLIELFAYLSEQLIYRLNRVTDANVCSFLKLLNGPGWKLPADGDIDAEVRRTVLALRRPQRAVTAADFEFLARAAAWPQVARAYCVPGRDPADLGKVKPAYMSLLLVPADGLAPSPDLIKTVGDALDPVRLLTTQLRVCAPPRLSVGFNLRLCLEYDADAKATVDAATAALSKYLHPLTGGTNGTGWPFGRAIYLSEIYRLLDAVPGVDYVFEPTLGTDPDEIVTATPGRRVPASGPLVAISLNPDELVDLVISSLNIIALPRST